MCGLRLDPNNPEDQKWLMGRVDKNTGLPVMQLLLKNANTDRATPEIPEEKKKGINKYGNKKIFREGVWWDSVWEYECYVILKSLENKNIITGLKTQIPYKFELNGVYITRYKADFTFLIPQDECEPKFIVADAKSEHTAILQRFLIQRKLMRAFFGLEITNFYKAKTNVEKLIFDIKHNRFTKT